LAIGIKELILRISELALARQSPVIPIAKEEEESPSDSDQGDGSRAAPKARSSARRGGVWSA
jgi:hypothetical protein